MLIFITCHWSQFSFFVIIYQFLEAYSSWPLLTSLPVFLHPSTPCWSTYLCHCSHFYKNMTVSFSGRVQCAGVWCSDGRPVCSTRGRGQLYYHSVTPPEGHEQKMMYAIFRHNPAGNFCRKCLKRLGKAVLQKMVGNFCRKYDISF